MTDRRDEPDNSSGSGKSDDSDDSRDATKRDSPVRRRPRRARLAAPEGSENEPFDPPTESRATGENDDRLRADRPPHWG